VKRAIQFSERLRNSAQNLPVSTAVLLKKYLVCLEQEDYLPGEIALDGQRSVFPLPSGEWLMIRRWLQTPVIEPEVVVLIEGVLSVEQFRELWVLYLNQQNTNKKKVDDGITHFLLQSLDAVERYKHHIAIAGGILVVALYTVASQLGAGNLVPKINLQPPSTQPAPHK
jgi:hypothetical protein